MSMFKYAELLKDKETGLYVKQGCLFKIIKSFTTVVDPKSSYYANLSIELLEINKRKKFLTNKKTRAHKSLGSIWGCDSMADVLKSPHRDILGGFKYIYERNPKGFFNKPGDKHNWLRVTKISGLDVEIFERADIGWKEYKKPNVVKFRFDEPEPIQISEGNAYTYCRVCGISVKNIPHSNIRGSAICYYCINNMKQKIEPSISRMDPVWKEEVEQELFARYLAVK